MDARELRIGNWVSNHGTLFIIRDGEDIDDINRGLDNPIFQPIPLTEQWLIDFGFEKERTEELDYSYYKTIQQKSKIEGILSPNLEFSIDRDNWGDFRCAHIKDTFLCEVEYVNQLQNLYFALTEKELEKKS